MRLQTNSTELWLEALLAAGLQLWGASPKGTKMLCLPSQLDKNDPEVIPWNTVEEKPTALLALKLCQPTSSEDRTVKAKALKVLWKGIPRQ